MRALLISCLLMVACTHAPELEVVKDREGHPRAEVTRRNGMKDGPVRLLQPDGSVKTTGRYAHDSRHGAWVTVGPSGDTLSIVTYKYGRKDGWQAYWAANGQLLRLEQFSKGEAHGPLYRFYADGMPRQISWYNRGVPNGLHTEWYKADDSAIALVTGKFEQGGRTGLWTWFYGDGRPCRQGHYIKGKQRGIWRYWSAKEGTLSTRDFGTP